MNQVFKPFLRRFILVFKPFLRTREVYILSNLDSFSTPGYLLSFSTSSYRNLDSFSTTKRIDRDFFWTLNSLSTASGLIELLFNLLLICPLADPRQLLLLMPFCSTPLDTSICWDLLGSYISANRDFPLIFLDLSTDLSFHLPKLSLSLQTSFLSVL